MNSETRGVRVGSFSNFRNLIYKFTTSVCDGARVQHRRPTGPGPAFPDSRISTDRARSDTPTVVTEPGVKQLCVFGGEGDGGGGGNIMSEYCKLLALLERAEVRGCLQLGTVNNTDPWGEREFKEEKCCNNEVVQ